MIDDIIVQFDEGLEEFLALWAKHLQQAGYFEQTLATRDGSVKAFYVMLTALKKLDFTEMPPSLKDFCGRNRIDIAFFLNAGREQRSRGGTAEMSLDYFKAMRLAAEDMIDEMVLFDSIKLKVLSMLRRYFDVIEATIIADWENADKDTSMAALEKSNWQLARDKSIYESIFDSTSNLVLITDSQGIVREANAQAKVFFNGKLLIGRYCGDLFGASDQSLNSLLHHFEADRTHEIKLQNGGYSHVFNLQIKPLSRASILSHGVMLISRTITSQKRCPSITMQVTMMSLGKVFPSTYLLPISIFSLCPSISRWQILPISRELL